jgi:hypothetical protein
MQVQQILHTQIKIVNSASLRDAFCNEIVKLSPLELWHLDFHGSSNLRNFVLSPSTACSKLTELNLSECRLVKETRSVKRFCLCVCQGQAAVTSSFYALSFQFLPPCIGRWGMCSSKVKAWTPSSCISARGWTRCGLHGTVVLRGACTLNSALLRYLFASFVQKLPT